MIIEYPKERLKDDHNELMEIINKNSAYGIVGNASAEIALQFRKVSRKMKLFYTAQLNIIEARHEFITEKPLFDGDREKFKQKLLLILGE